MVTARPDHFVTGDRLFCTIFNFNDRKLRKIHYLCIR